MLLLCLSACGAGGGLALRTLGALLRGDPAAALLDGIGRIERGVAAADTYYGAASDRSGAAAERAPEYRELVAAVLREVAGARASLDDDRPLTRERVDGALTAPRREVEALRAFLDALGRADATPRDGGASAPRLGTSSPGPAELRARESALVVLEAATAP